MTVKERLIQYIKSKGMSIRAFCRTVGLSETYVTSMRNSVQGDKLVKITFHFPDLNPQWLLTGEGEMLRDVITLPPIDRQTIVNAGSEVFKDKLIEMFKAGEIFSASIVWEQHRLIIDLTRKNEDQQKQIERLKCLLAQHGINAE